MFFYTRSPYFMCQCTELEIKVRILEENKLNATTQQFITAKNNRLRVKTGE